MMERLAWMALAATPGVGDHTFRHLLAAYGSAAAALDTVTRLPAAQADRSIARATGMPLRPGLAAAVRSSAADPGRVMRMMERLGGWTLTPLDADYPGPLLRIEEAPPVLYGLGSPSALSGMQLVAVVGTRRPTTAGRDLAARISTALSDAGVTVVSGLAMGIDGVAHRAALEAGARTIAVVGSGPDEPGPAGHRTLAGRIATSGTIVGELAPGVRATRGTFPRRNRIISGLARATILVEAPVRSGALITAAHALTQGRQVLVATGRPFDPHVAGNLTLLRESPAQPLVGLDEMLADLGLGRDGAGEGAGVRTTTLDRATASGDSLEAALGLLGTTQRAVAMVLAHGPRSVDELCRDTGLGAGVVAASLTMLQLRGWSTTLGAVHLPAGPLVRMAGTRRP